MSATLLVQDAYVLAEILAEEGETANAAQITIGLKYLNITIRKINISSDVISLITDEDFNLPADINVFTLTGYTKLLKVQYNLGGIRYDIKLLSLNDFKDRSRIVNNTGIPYIGYPKRTPTGIDLEIFFTPSVPYLMTVTGYKNITEVVSDTILSGIEKFYEDYLLYKLAYRLCNYYQKPIPAGISNEVREYEQEFEKLKVYRIDRKLSILGRGSYNNSIAAYNIGRGYNP